MKWAGCAAILMASAVMFGAFGTHGLKDALSEHYLEIYRTGGLYHLIHGLGLFIVAVISVCRPGLTITVAGGLMFSGTVIFSGSLYILSVTQISKIGMITPVGGLMLIISWILVAAHCFRREP